MARAARFPPEGGDVFATSCTESAPRANLQPGPPAARMAHFQEFWDIAALGVYPPRQPRRLTRHDHELEPGLGAGPWDSLDGAWPWGRASTTTGEGVRAPRAFGGRPAGGAGERRKRAPVVSGLGRERRNTPRRYSGRWVGAVTTPQRRSGVRRPFAQHLP